MKLRNLVLLVVFFCATMVQAAVIASYEANVDPETVGWTLGTSGTAATVGGGVEVDGTKYWLIDDPADGLNQYKSDVSPSYGTTRGSATGWTYSMNVKVLDCDAGSAGCVLRLLDGWRAWLVSVNEGGVEIGGSTIVSKDMTDGYHVVQMVCDPSNTNAISVYVDGTEYLSNYSSGLIYQGYSAGFGAGSTPGTGSARYNSVVFETGVNIVPEPATMLLFGMCGVVSFIRRRK